jgi:hypothetical protein
MISDDSVTAGFVVRCAQGSRNLFIRAATISIVSLFYPFLFCRPRTSGNHAVPDLLMLTLIVLAVLAPVAYASVCRDI